MNYEVHLGRLRGPQDAAKEVGEGDCGKRSAVGWTTEQQGETQVDRAGGSACSGGAQRRGSGGEKCTFSAFRFSSKPSEATAFFLRTAQPESEVAAGCLAFTGLQ